MLVQIMVFFSLSLSLLIFVAFELEYRVTFVPEQYCATIICFVWCCTTYSHHQLVCGILTFSLVITGKKITEIASTQPQQCNKRQ